MAQTLNNQQAAALAEKWIAGTISPEEEMLFFNWYNANIGRDTILPDSFASGEESLKTRMFSAIEEQKLSHPAPVIPLRKKRPVRWVAAAVILFCITGLVTWLLKKNTTATTELAKQETHTPQGILLTLADGRKIQLDSFSNGRLATENGTTVTLQKGALAYAASTGYTPSTPAYNTLFTPNSRQFQLMLPDGTKVWLNALSTISYPVAFTGSNRTVELSGEAYFEIASDSRQPFFVKTATTTVKVLGTSFNIMAYPDEPNTQTTLLSGKVSLQHTAPNQTSKNQTSDIINQPSAISKSANLLPGQQALTTAGDFIIKEIEAEEAIAWKNGYFQFDHAPLQVIMRQLSRWYNIEVVYEGEITEEEFSGQIERSANITQVLKVLELKQVHFTVQGKKIIVKP